MSSPQSEKPDVPPPWEAFNTNNRRPAPVALAVDVVLLTVRDARLQALIVWRSEDNRHALPGAFVKQHEDARQTAERALREKTGLDRLYLEQLATFTAPGRDWRGWIPTVAYIALVPPETSPTDPNAQWVDTETVPKLFCDHNEILREGIERIRGKLWWSNVAVGILADPFTLAEARHVYEAISGKKYDPSTFARDLRATGLVEATGEEKKNTGGRPAALYRFLEDDLAWGVGRRKRVAPNGGAPSVGQGT